MGDENDKKRAVATIKPKKVKARRRPDGSLEILEEVKEPEQPEQSLDSFSFDREALQEELAKEQGMGTYGPDGKLDLFEDD
jgi:hypothetical protein